MAKYESQRKIENNWVTIALHSNVDHAKKVLVEKYSDREVRIIDSRTQEVIFPSREIVVKDQPSRKNKDTTSEKEFKEALKKCSTASKRAYDTSLVYYTRVSQILEKLEKNLDEIAPQLLADKDAAKYLFGETVRQITTEISDQSTTKLDDLKRYLDKQKEHLKDFTVVLFGKTKAGKSTIREAFTRGDGGTIGKGAQRTTQDVKEYEWQGLRLIDTPGIEAYKGEEDKRKAMEITREADMVIFLVSDDSIQPKEFEAMAWLKQINKYFFILLNVKEKLDNKKRIERFIKAPEKIFDTKRLQEHEQRIKENVANIFEVEKVDIVYIQALAAFLSTQNEYLDYSDELWNLSRVEKVYNLITKEIVKTGYQKRVLTICNGVVNFIDDIIRSLNTHRKSLEVQVGFMNDELPNLEKELQKISKEGNQRIERKCKEKFDKIRGWIPRFVDNYLGKEGAQLEYQKRINKETEYIQKEMEGLFQELVNKVKEALKEFEKEYMYDMGTIKIDPPEINNFQKDYTDDTLRYVSMGLGATSAIAVGIAAFAGANFWNPIGWVAGIASVVVGIFGWLFGSGNDERRAWQRQKQEAKDLLYRKLHTSENEIVKSYQDLLQKYITSRQNEELKRIKTYINQLSKISNELYIFGIQPLKEQNVKLISVRDLMAK
ncbi:GTPase domain-containing protein [Phormidium tenue]|uniref:50S ribosome-binding GTPase n=1 Tax=Phormidium tenue FACHB-1050 TaxID=2692857 RepID=A0ABR8C6T9_9CYAN|nr:GTPase domain-containing protein [Phormidium tenue]MBD2316482.1 50S ribosome-binding GTPase [Phormidium tenue FACHB-1050]